MDEQSLKAAFAAFYITEAQTSQGAFTAALKLFPAERDRGEACRISFEWPQDPEVIIELQRLKGEGVTNKRLPSKDEVIELLWGLAKDTDMSAKERKDSARIVAELMNYIPKGDSDENSKRRMPTAPVYQLRGPTDNDS